MILFIVFIIAAFIALLICHFASQGHKLTGTATVLSRRLEVAKLGSEWADYYNRLITFRLSDGDEIELYVTKEAYALLEDGDTGQLVWQGDQLLSFESDS